MKQEQKTSELYFCMLYCTGAQLPVIGWVSGAEPIINAAMLVSKYVGQTQPEPLLLALTRSCQHSMVEKGMATLPD